MTQSKSIRLPFRLIPDRSDLTGIYWLVAALVVFVYMGAKVVNGVIMGPSENALAGLGRVGYPFFVLFVVWFGLLWLAILFFVLRLLMQDVLQWIPGSPF